MFWGVRGTDGDKTLLRPYGSRAQHTEEHEPGLLTEVEMRQRERENLLAVLEKTPWKVNGPDGAAEFLGGKANTLMARMRAMGLKRSERRKIR